MKHILLLFTAFTLLQVTMQAAVLKGKITEGKSGEAAIGALITIDERKDLYDISGLDGSFIIRNITAGPHRIRVHYAGFEDYTASITLTDSVTTIGDIVLITANRELREVSVYAKDPAGEHTARNLERHADQVMNIISGKAIQRSPDLTVANVIQRISGISLERNSNGDGQYAILRGMDKRYNYTLVNGIKIPSPDNKYRFVPLDIFPSELLDRLEVYKAMTPEMEGDAIGGAVNMVMKDAPDHSLFTANLATGYSELFASRDFMSYDHRSVHKQSPYERKGNKYNATPADFSKATVAYTQKQPLPNLVAGFAAGNRYFKNKLGLLLAGSYQNTYRGSSSIFFDIDKVDTFKGVTLTKYSKREYSEQQVRSGLHLKSDYRFNSRNKLQWYNAWMHLDNIQVRDVTAMQLTIGGYDPEKGNATLGYSTRSRLTRQDIVSSTLQGEHMLTEELTFSWSAVYAIARQQVPDNTTIPLLGTMSNKVMQKTFIQDASRRWEHNSDQDLASYLRLDYHSKVGNVPVDWSTGGLFRYKTRENFYNQYQLRPANLQAKHGLDFNSNADIEWIVQNPRGSVGSASNYQASEQTGSGFLQFKARPDKLDITGGIRAEYTKQGYLLDFPLGEDRPEGNQEYTDLLPSLHLKYMPNWKTNIRASYFRSLNRPGFFEIVPYSTTNEEYQERGNPDLKRALADNADLRYEWYPRQGEQLMAGIFYKRIQDPIEYVLQRDPVRGQDIYYAPGNFGIAHNYGLELDAIKYFRKWGVKGNYTYTHSAITTSKAKRIRNEKGDLQTINVDQTRPLYGQAAHIANLALLFRDQRHGWDLQLAGNYTGERIVTVSQFLFNDLWQKAFIQLDFSMEKTFAGRWACFVKVNNLLNTPMEVYMKEGYNNTDRIPEQDRSGQTLIRRDFFQRSYLAGIRWKL